MALCPVARSAKVLKRLGAKPTCQRRIRYVGTDPEPSSLRNQIFFFHNLTVAIEDCA